MKGEPMNWAFFRDNWKTTTTGLTILLVWIAKYFFSTEIPTGVAEAITGVLTFIGLALARDAHANKPA
jgi:uncharacterized membrane-anchored protein